MIEKELGALNAMLSEDQAYSFAKTFINIINNSFRFKNVERSVSDEGDTGSFSINIKDYVIYFFYQLEFYI